MQVFCDPNLYFDTMSESLPKSCLKRIFLIKSLVIHCLQVPCVYFEDAVCGLDG